VTDELHTESAALGAEAEKLAAGVDVSSARTFQVARKLIDDALKDVGITAKINAAVAELVPGLTGCRPCQGFGWT
jgi:hypothetical protein